jgi:hypothetical protein
MAATNVQAFSGDVVLGEATYRYKKSWTAGTGGKAYVYMGNVKSTDTSGIRINFTAGTNPGVTMIDISSTLHNLDTGHAGGNMINFIHGNAPGAPSDSIDLGYVYVSADSSYQLWIEDPSDDTLGTVTAYINCQGYYNYDTTVSDVAQGGAAPTNFQRGVAALAIEKGGPVGIGTNDATSSAQLEIRGPTSTAINQGQVVIGYKELGTEDSNVIAIQFKGYNGSEDTSLGSIQIERESTTNGNDATRMILYTRADGSVQAEAVRMTSEQKVGIGGITSPAESLEVSGNYRAGRTTGGYTFGLNSGGDLRAGIYSDANNGLDFKTGSDSQAMYISDGLQVFIPNYIKHIDDDNTYMGFESNDLFVVVTNGSHSIKCNSSQNVDIQNYIRHIGDENTYFGFDSNDSIHLRTAASDRLKIDGSRIVTTVNLCVRRDNDTQYHPLLVYSAFGNNSGSPIIQLNGRANDTNIKQYMNQYGNNYQACGVTPYGSGAYLYFRYDDVNYRGIVGGTSQFFTGQHVGYPEDFELKSNVVNYVGKIVSATGKGYKSYNGVTGDVIVGNKAIQINESLPNVNLSNVACDPRVIGVVTNRKDDNQLNTNGEIDEDQIDTGFDKGLFDRVRFNSIGEGSIWVSNMNGSISNGDYITSSNIAGYGQKQDDDILHNYTVAKATMSCDFNPGIQPVLRNVRDTIQVDRWVRTNHYEIGKDHYDLGLNDPDESHLYITEEYTNTSNTRTHTKYFKIDKEIVSADKSDNPDFVHELHDKSVIRKDDLGRPIMEETGETELEYDIRYLDANGNEVDESNHVYKAAFIGCTYHCG